MTTMRALMSAPVARQEQAEAAALAVFTLELDARADQPGELLRDVQAEPGAFVAPARLHLLERLEQLRLVLAADADAGIEHADLGEARAVFPPLAQHQPDRALLGELDAVV